MARCAIIGFDGIDVDVLSNLYVFYRHLGYEVALADDWTPCDLLVVTRGTPRRLPTTAEMPKMCHLYSYTGVERFAPASWPADLPTLQIAVSSVVVDDTGLAHAGAAVDVVVAPPPVWVDFWVRRRVAATHDQLPVHIGHFKQTDWDAGDPTLRAFVEFARASSMRVWGRGWEPHLKPEQLMGQAAAERVSDMYAGLRVGAGLMYSWQRGKTFSGRFWQAPLAGCPLMTEVPAPFGAAPGVILADYASADALNASLQACVQAGDALSQAAREYWGDRTATLMRRVREWSGERLATRRAGSGLARGAGFLLAQLQTEARLRYRESYRVVHQAVRAYRSSAAAASAGSSSPIVQ
jgi:hypothetical protein